MRDILLSRLEQDLVGPYEKEEVLTSRPSDVYLTGILWPRETHMGAEEDEHFGLSGAEQGEMEHGGEEEEVSLAGLARPCSAGVSFAVRSEEDRPRLNVVARFATYGLLESNDSENGGQENGNVGERKHKEWRRQAHHVVVNGIELGNASSFVDLEPFEAPPGVKLHIRTAPWSKGMLATITLLNWAEPDESGGREEIEKLTLFQVRIEIRPEQGTALVARPSRRLAFDEDGRSAELLYRNANEFATGHVCSVEWKASSDSGTVDMISTSWIPKTMVPATSAVGHEIFNKLRGGQKYQPLSARWLSTANPKDIGQALQQLPAAYEEWIDHRENEVLSLPERFHAQARKNIESCRKIHRRMVEGATRISGDSIMLRAFRLANLAMEVQHGWNYKRDKMTSLEWRPFQLGFILLSAVSVVDRKNPDREIMDLLWFPTGGGKTEAYLALIAFLSFYRRLSSRGDPDAGNGVAAIMRYTLRLLTTQQFTRAASVLLACEAIRRGRVRDASISHTELGNTPFSVGLWVGGAAVPNKVRDAALALNGATDQPTPKQLLHCPACQERLNWEYNEQAASIHVKCENDACLLFHPEAPLPIWTVDEDVYRMRPTLLIGTIDKFAQIIRRKEINTLFGLDKGTPPDLILQDELHLISGPLGTIAGLYEVAIDRMFSLQGVRPKIIGSTATIRRASEQVASLFDRETAQFPPSCLDADDSAFAVVDQNAPGRIYAGITTVGRSAKFTLQAVAGSILQSSFAGTSDSILRDPYWTLVSYFNSLRELGGALVLMQDDVNDNLALVARRRGETVRHPKFVEELTSRRTQAEIRDMLTRLAIPADAPDALDVVLATNMLSVGVDIPRLGLMLMNGQPKGIAEYIQATSRVGRGEVPGLVVAILNNARARDRSHYESFLTWHETLYRDVEPTSVTPFASRARDRALHAVLVALVRHLVPGMLDKPVFSDDSMVITEDLIESIVQRSKKIDPQESAVRRELEKRLEDWEFREPKSYWSIPTRNSLLQDAERAATLRAMGRMPGEAWPTLNSMRDVEASICFRLAERLRKKTPGGDSDGQ